MCFSVTRSRSTKTFLHREAILIFFVVLPTGLFLVSSMLLLGLELVTGDDDEEEQLLLLLGEGEDCVLEKLFFNESNSESPAHLVT